MSFKFYLERAPILEAYDLFNDGVIQLHWSNWRRSSSFLREKFGQDTRFRELEQELFLLKSEYVWLVKGLEQQKWSLFDLYRSYLEPAIKEALFDEGEMRLLVSLRNEAGPYISVKSGRWINPDLYRKFIYYKLLTKPTNLREFRLTVNFPVLCSFDDRHLDKTSLGIEQIGHDGVLINFGNSYEWEQLKNSTKITLCVDLEKVHRFFDKPNHESLCQIGENFLKGDDQQLSVCIESSLVQRGSYDHNFFVYIPYDYLGPNLSKSLRGIVNHFEVFFTRSLSKIVA